MGPRNPKPLRGAPAAEKKKAPGFLERLFAFFASDDPERQKQRLLRDIGAQLKRSRPRLYNPGQRTAEPALGRFFYEVYRAIAAAQVLLKDAKTSAALKTAVIDLSLDAAAYEWKERLTEKSIDERAKRGTDPSVIAGEVKQDLAQLLAVFSPEWMNDVDALYNRLLFLIDLVTFDYFLFLRRFDAGIPERDFSYKPRFASVEAALITDELQDFLEVLPGIDTEADWDQLLAILKEHRSVEVINRDFMRRALQLIRDAQRTGVLHMIVRHATGNPAWKPMVRVHRERVVEPYITKLKAEAETTAQKVARGRRDEKIAELARQVFGTESIPRLSNYAETANADFAQKMLGGFLHVTSLNYMKAFLASHLPKSVREIVDLLLIKGQWQSHQVSQQMSEAFHQLLKTSEKIERFDGELAQDGELGLRLHAFVIRAERDRKALAQLRLTLQQINDEARAMIGDAVQNLVLIARVLKLAYDDFPKQKPELLTNWRDLKGASDKDIRELIAAVYRRIHGFVQLIQFYR